MRTQLVSPSVRPCATDRSLRKSTYETSSWGFGAHTRTIEARHVVRGLEGETTLGVSALSWGFGSWALELFWHPRTRVHQARLQGTPGQLGKHQHSFCTSQQVAHAHSQTPLLHRHKPVSEFPTQLTYLRRAFFTHCSACFKFTNRQAAVF